MSDQILSSLTNVGLAVIAARTLAVSQFAAFTFVYTAYLLALGASRAVTSEPLLVRYSDVDEAALGRAAAMAGGAATAIGAVLGLSLIAIAALTSGSLPTALIALGLCLPGLLLQDVCRFAFFAQGKPHYALASDALWVGLMVIGVAAIRLASWKSPGAIVAAWGVSGVGAGLVALQYGSITPRIALARSWWMEEKTLGSRFFGEWAVTGGVGQAAIYAVALVADAVAVAALRGARVLVGPLNIFILGVRPVAIAEGVRLARRSRSRFLAFLVILSVTLASVVVFVGAGAALLPNSLGRAILGDTWDESRPVLVPTAFMVAGNCAALGAMVGLRALAAAGESLRTRIVVSSASLAGFVGGAYLAGMTGAALGGAIASWLGAAVWWMVLLRTDRSAHSNRPVLAETQPVHVGDAIVPWPPLTNADAEVVSFGGGVNP